MRSSVAVQCLITRGGMSEIGCSDVGRYECVMPYGICQFELECLIMKSGAREISKFELECLMTS